MFSNLINVVNNISAYINPNFLKFKSILKDCWNNGRYSFDQCSDLEQELLARYYYFSLDSADNHGVSEASEAVMPPGSLGPGV